MPKFPPACVQRLRDAGLRVLNAAYDELEDHEVFDYYGRLTVFYENHRFLMFSHDEQWCIEYCGPSPGDFLACFDTPDDAVSDALKFCAGDERFRVVEDFFRFTDQKLPSQLLDKTTAHGIRWERMSAARGYEFFKGDLSVSVQVCKERNEDTWLTIYFDNEPRTAMKRWSSPDEAVDEVIRLMDNL